jgi:hypothetical protein
MPFRVLLTGGYDTASAPHRTLAKAFAREGIEATFRPDLPLAGGRQWLREVLNTDAVVHIEYADPDPYSARQLAIAIVLGRPVLRWWVGTDVLLCLRDRATQAKAALIERAGVHSIAVARHLVEELASVGLSARWIPSALDTAALKPSIVPQIPRSILVYLPAQRLQFYRADMVRELALLNADLTFLIAGDESHSLRDLPNVISLGWVENMDSIYRNTGCVLRLTEHDGLPRIVIEALLRGRYVIYSWPLEGCWLAKTTQEAHEKLKLFRAVTRPNLEGAAAITQLYQPPPEARLAQWLKMESRRYRLKRRAAAFTLAVDLTLRDRLKKLRTRDA